MDKFFDEIMVKNGTTIELIILGIILLLQIWFIFQILKRIDLFKGIFKTIPKVDTDSSQLEFEGKNSVMQTIVENINSYLSSNQSGFVDFNIVRDIITRNVDSAEETITNKISAPLYLGLAGTMIGIVIGLMSLDLEAGPNLGDSSNFNALIGPLIKGVQYAMFVSAFGLIATTALSVFVFRKAKTEVDEGKNSLLSDLQNDLLPELVQSDDQAMRSMTKAIDKFNVQAPAYVQDLKATGLSVAQSLKTEQDILQKIQELDVKKMATANASVFKELSKMMDNFKSFTRYYNKLNQSLGNTVALNQNLEQMIARTEDVNMVMQEVKQIIESGGEATTFFNAHIQSFEQYGDSVNRAIASADQRMSSAVDELSKSVVNQVDSFKKSVATYDKTLSDSYNNSIEHFNNTYQNSVPKLEQLDRLEQIENQLNGLTALNGRFDAIAEQLRQQQSAIQAQTNELKNLKIELEVPENLKIQLPENTKSLKDKIMEGLVIALGGSMLIYIAYELITQI